LVELIKTLEIMQEAFPENRALAAFVADMRRAQGDSALETDIVKRWHFEMKHHPHTGLKRERSLYTAVTERDYAGFVDGGMWVMQAIHGRSIFFDPYMADEQRNDLLEYFDDINAIAFMYGVIPDDARRICMGHVHDLTSSTAPINSDTLSSLVQETWQANTDNVVVWTTHFSKVLMEPDAREILLHVLDLPLLRPVLDLLGLGSDQVRTILRGLFSTLQATADSGTGGDGGDGGGTGAAIDADTLASVSSLMQTVMPNIKDLADGLGRGELPAFAGAGVGAGAGAGACTGAGVGAGAGTGAGAEDD
jgi:hypothetical protein